VSVARRDFASRLRPLQASLKRRLARADVLADMIRAVNASLDPEKVADALVARVSDWIPAPGWLDGLLRRLEELEIGIVGPVGSG